MVRNLIEGIRYCKKCDTHQPIENFYKDGFKKDPKHGRSFTCKSCKKIKNKKYRENPEIAERDRANSRKWYQDNIEYAREQGRIYSQKWRDENPEWHRENSREYRRDPSKKEILWRQSAKKRAILKEAFLEDVDRELVYNRDGRICGICKNVVLDFDKDFELDHIIPLSRDGKHSYCNTQTSHARCNNKKNARLMEEIEKRYDDISKWQTA